MYPAPFLPLLPAVAFRLRFILKTLLQDLLHSAGPLLRIAGLAIPDEPPKAHSERDEDQEDQNQCGNSYDCGEKERRVRGMEKSPWMVQY